MGGKKKRGRKIDPEAQEKCGESGPSGQNLHKKGSSEVMRRAKQKERTQLISGAKERATESQRPGEKQKRTKKGK